MRTLELEDASQLGMLAYEKENYGEVKDSEKVVNDLSSDLAREIARVIVDPQSVENADPEVERAAKYFSDWAHETAQRSRQFTYRPPTF